MDLHSSGFLASRHGCCNKHSCVGAVVDAAGEPLTSLQRQRHFDKIGNLEHVVFDTVNVYTFVICQSIVDMPSYRYEVTPPPRV